MEEQRGFSLLEVLVALALAAVMGLFALRAATAALHSLSLQGTRIGEEASVQDLTSRLASESESAWAIFTPPSDVNGSPNADGHELDFFMRGARNIDEFWAYSYDAAAKTLARYTYAEPGSPPALDRTYTGITAFFAKTYPLTALQDASSKIYSPLYAGATLTDGGVRFFNDTAPWIEGGNAITYVTFSAGVNTRVLHLSTESAPSGFTVVLNYTPAPSPAPAIAVWPQYVAYTVSGQYFASTAPPMNAAMALNALLGGGVAQAASCNAMAFNDAAHTIPAAVPSWVTGETVASDGCYDGKIWLNEASYTGQILDYPGHTTCTSANLQSGTWNSLGPSPPNVPDGPTNAQAFSGAGTPVANCLLGFEDAKSAPNTIQSTASVYQYACSVIGQSCTVSVGGWPNDSPSCTPPNFSDPGGMNPGYTGTGSFTIAPSSPPGTFSQDDAAATATFTRSGAGSVTITAYATYEGWKYVQVSGRFQCVALPQSNVYQTWTIP